MSKKVTILHLDDWEVVYVDGKKVDRGGHSGAFERWAEDELNRNGYAIEYIYGDSEEYVYQEIPDSVTDVLLDDGFYYGEAEKTRL